MQPQRFIKIALTAATSGNIRKPLPPKFQTCSKEVERKGNSANDGLGGTLGNRGKRQSSTDQICWLRVCVGKAKGGRPGYHSTHCRGREAQGPNGNARVGVPVTDCVWREDPLVTGRVGEAATP